MEKSFDFGRLMKNHEKKHKSKPTQFNSVAGGVQRRLENNKKCRKSSRLTIFDSIRNLSRCASPVPVSEAQQKMEHRRQQLEKWKEEKEKKKKEAASHKKKPFVAGVPQVSLKFVPPPPAPKPSTSGRVTRSQTARNSKLGKEKQNLSISFAPRNATFKPPQMKNFPKIPYENLTALKPMKTKITIFSFDPVIPKSTQDCSIKDVKQTRTRSQNKSVAESKITQRNPDVKTRGRTAKPLLKNNTTMFQSTSSSETDSIKSTLRNRKSLPNRSSPVFQSTSSETDSSCQSPVPTIKIESLNKTRNRKSLPTTNSPILVSKTPRKSSAKSPKQFTPKNPVPKSESSSEERLRSPKSPSDIPMTPEQIIEEAKRMSPCVTMSRGKDNARREMKKKLEEGLLDEDTSDIDNVDHFRRQLASEIKRMTETCETWDRISEQTVLPDSIQECILSAVGQSRLLMSQKLQQFASLVERCARPEPGTALVTPADLHGFWDMVFMQVENVDMRFKKLEELRNRGWVEEQPTIVAKKKPVKAPKTKPVGGASRIKEMIAAARKAKKEQIPTPAPVEKAFEAGFFCVRSPVRSPTPHHPGTPLCKHSLLKAVLSSEAKKSASKNSASFAMLRASILGKNVEYDGVAPLPQTPITTNTNATPGRSILKHPDTGRKSAKKSIKVVLFDQSDNEMNTSFDNQPMVKLDDLDMEKLNVDSGVSAMDVEKEEKENSKKSNKLIRQDATEDRSPVLTRSRRKSISTPHENTKTPKETKTPQEKTRRSTRKSKILEDVETNVMEDDTPKRSTRRRREVALSKEVAA